METERKFILKGFPKDLPLISESIVYQYFLSIKPYIRIREYIGEKHNFVMTIKGEGTLERTEVEFSLTEEQYNELKTLCNYPPIKKVFHKYSLFDGKTLECSHVDPETKNAFFYAEVEFSSKEEALAFNPTFDFESEETENEKFQMNYYWERTRILK